MGMDPEITEFERFMAMENLRKEILGYAEKQNQQFEWQRQMLTGQRKVNIRTSWISFLVGVALLIGLIFLIYTITKPLPATLFDMKYIHDQNELLNIREKNFDQKKEAERKQLSEEWSALRAEKAKTDSDIAIRRKDLLKMMDKTKTK